jgi:hypothetical protein
MNDPNDTSVSSIEEDKAKHDLICGLLEIICMNIRSIIIILNYI